MFVLRTLQRVPTVRFGVRTIFVIVFDGGTGKVRKGVPWGRK